MNLLNVVYRRALAISGFITIGAALLTANLPSAAAQGKAASADSGPSDIFGTPVLYLPPDFSNWSATVAFENNANLNAPVDFNKDGLPDLVISTRNRVPIALQQTDGTFKTVATYSLAGPVAVADLNGDGKQDLVVCTSLVNDGAVVGSLNILFGNGDGTFQTPAVYAANNADSVAVGDFNGDGKPDLAVANQCGAGGCEEGAVSVLLNNGDGTFPTAVAYPSKVGAFSLAVGDFNNDGKLDVAVANDCDPRSCHTRAGSVSVLLGNGDGTLGKAFTYSTRGIGSDSVAIGDFNGDGRLDLAVANECSSACGHESEPASVSVLLGKGNGKFLPARQNLFEFGSGALPGDLPQSAAVVLADFDGDGKLDMAAATVYGSALFLGDGSGRFLVPTTFYNAHGAWALGASDFNLDGKPDLFVLLSDSEFGEVAFLPNVASGFHYSSILGLTSSTAISQPGQSVTFTATLTPAFNAGPVTGTVTFNDGGPVSGGGIVLAIEPISGDQASFISSALSVGVHSITASYSGDATYLPETSRDAVIETAALWTTTTVLTSNSNPSSFKQGIVFTAKVASSGPSAPTGSITFEMGDKISRKILGTVPVVAGGATLTYSSLTKGSHPVSAVYSGDAASATSTSAFVTQVVN